MAVTRLDPYRYGCPPISNPNGGMSTSTNNTGLSKKMRYAVQLRAASSFRGGTHYYLPLPLNAFGSYSGAPGGYSQPIRNTF
jgi:hypothetical protein